MISNPVLVALVTEYIIPIVYEIKISEEER